MYKEPYVRFPGSDFELSEIDNKYSHLSNNCVNKDMDEADKGRVLFKHHIEGNMWSLEQLNNYLNETEELDEWSVIAKKIKQLVIHTL